MKKTTFFRTMLIGISLLIFDVNISAQGTISNPIFSETFGTLADATAISTSNSNFSYVRVSTSSTSNSIVNQIVSKSPGSFSGSSVLIGAKGGSISTVDKTALTAFTSGMFTLKFKTPDDLTSALMLSAVGTGVSFGSANGFTGAQLSAGFQVTGTKLQVRANSAWTDVQAVAVSTTYTVAVLFNNTAASITYADKTLPSNKCHVWVNGTYINEYSSATASLAASAFRIYTTTSQFEVDDVFVYSTLPDVPTGFENVIATKLSASNGKITFYASANQSFEVYNSVGQKLLSRPTAEGFNTISVSARGMMLVKVGNQISKVIL